MYQHHVNQLRNKREISHKRAEKCEESCQRGKQNNDYDVYTDILCEWLKMIKIDNENALNFEQSQFLRDFVTCTNINKNCVMIILEIST